MRRHKLQRKIENMAFGTVLSLPSYDVLSVSSTGLKLGDLLGSMYSLRRTEACSSELSAFFPARFVDVEPCSLSCRSSRLFIENEDILQGFHPVY